MNQRGAHWGAETSQVTHTSARLTSFYQINADKRKPRRAHFVAYSLLTDAHRCSPMLHMLIFGFS
jgi:hypothetical protein